MSAGPPVRDVSDFLTDLDAVLAAAPATGEQQEGPAPTVPAPAPAPDDEPAHTGEQPEPGSWEEATAGSRREEPTRSRERRISARGWRPYGPTTDLNTEKEPAQEDPATGGVQPTIPPRPIAPPAPAPAPGPVKVTVADDEEDQDDDADEEGRDGQGVEGGEQVAPEATRAQLVMTTVQAWRPPVGPRGAGWFRAVAYTGSGILAGWFSGFTHGTHQTLRDLSVNPDAVGGIALAAALAALMISRSRRTWIALGCALALVLLVSLMSLPVFTGCVATGLVWGLDQYARHMRPVIAWTVRAAFSAVVLATGALVWTTIVHHLTGASQ
ncbi:hypothetical protein OG234_13425 [Streptomyces sp. NBC_01420]|uniref:hypothetical protein n=1 Tax=Streptomyces sp. NBC_01420 TaxID=2903858 RepID=UPI00324A4C18